MILYIHGFRTTYDSFIAKIFKKYFKDELISSDHSYIPKVAIEELKDIIINNNIIAIIASSFGGFYATYLSNLYDIKIVLINPSVNPHTTTSRYLGLNNKQDGTTFIWEKEHLEQLKSLCVKKPNNKNILLLLKKTDEVLNYKVALRRYNYANLILDDTGDHRFSDIDKYINNIKSFIKI
jgi:predicted esterase YcpF (UPF0227 family)